MRRIVHLSDLHYGRDDPALEAPLLQTIDAINPDLVIVSGDFTQRARKGQFAAARRFLDRIAAPVLAVPGNHDTPLDEPWVRFLWPFARYRRHIARDLEPAFADDVLCVLGINTVNRFAWQRGKFRNRTVRRVCDAFAGGDRRLKIVVLHHPLEHGPETGKTPMRGARRALRALAGCGADVVLSGHLHMAGAAPFGAAPGLLFVQAGTGLSLRRRGEENSFNLLEAEGAHLTVTRYGADTTGRFAPTLRQTFRRAPGGWSIEENT